MILDPDKWVEVSPCVYERKADYTPEQIEMLNTRPTELINAVLRANGLLRSQRMISGGME